MQNRKEIDSSRPGQAGSRAGAPPAGAAAQLRIMQLTAVVSPVLMILLGMNAILAGTVAFYRRWAACIGFSLAALLCIGLLVWIDRYYQRRKRCELAQQPAPAADSSQLASVFGAAQLAEHACEARRMQNGVEFSIQIYDTPVFDEACRDEAQKAFQKPTKAAEIPIGDSAKYARLRLILCDRADPEALQRLQRSARRSLDRVECHFDAVICRENATLYYPHIFDALDAPQLKRYRAFLDILSMITALGSEPQGQAARVSRKTTAVFSTLLLSALAICFLAAGIWFLTGDQKQLIPWAVGMLCASVVLLLYLAFGLLRDPFVLELQQSVLSASYLLPGRSAAWDVSAYYCYRHTNLHAQQWLILSKQALSRKQLRRMVFRAGFHRPALSGSAACINCSGFIAAEADQAFFERIAALALNGAEQRRI